MERVGGVTTILSPMALGGNDEGNPESAMQPPQLGLYVGSLPKRHR